MLATSCSRTTDPAGLGVGCKSLTRTTVLPQNGFDTSAVPAAAPAAATPAAATPASASASAPQRSGDTTAYMDIPQALVGKVIGKGGETIKFVQNDTNTKVQIDHQTPGEQKRVTIQSFTGDAAAVEAAKAHIQRIITTDEPITGDIHQVVDCPQGIVGRVIGRGGETIRALQQAYHLPELERIKEAHTGLLTVRDPLALGTELSPPFRSTSSRHLTSR